MRLFFIVNTNAHEYIMNNDVRKNRFAPIYLHKNIQPLVRGVAVCFLMTAQVVCPTGLGALLFWEDTTGNELRTIGW